MKFYRGIRFNGGDRVAFRNLYPFCVHQGKGFFNDQGLKRIQFGYFLNMAGSQIRHGTNGIQPAIVNKFPPYRRENIGLDNRLHSGFGHTVNHRLQSICSRFIQLTQKRRAFVGMCHFSRRLQITAVKCQPRHHAFFAQYINQNLNVAQPILERQCKAVLFKQLMG